MFGFHRKKADVLNHWIAFVDEFQTSPSEFYTKLESELYDRKVPKMEMSKLEFAEGGLLSEKRTYLRMLRERIAFDVCAAPFGQSFIFSCRTCEIPRVLQVWQMLGVFAFLCFMCWVFAKIFGAILGMIILAAVFSATIYCLRHLVAMGLQDLDKTLSHSPLVGSIYEMYFRAETYYRLDSRLSYIHLIPTIVKSLAEDATAEKGVKLIEQYEMSPILGEIYKRTPRPPADAQKDILVGRLSM
jgi:hypothetical protein